MNKFSLEFLIVRNRAFGFLVGWSGYFFQQLKLDFFRQSERFYFCCHKRLIIIAIRPYTQV